MFVAGLYRRSIQKCHVRLRCLKERRLKDVNQIQVKPETNLDFTLAHLDFFAGVFEC